MQGEEGVSKVEKSQQLREDVIECYRLSIHDLQKYNLALRKHIGNHHIYAAEFCGHFESLFTLTRFVPALENYKTNKDNKTNEDNKTKKEKSLLSEIQTWLDNNPHSNMQNGIKLFLAYQSALFNEKILSLD